MSPLFHRCGCCTVCVFFILMHKGRERHSIYSTAAWTLCSEEPHSAVHCPNCIVVCASKNQNSTVDNNMKSRDVLTVAIRMALSLALQITDF
jgi:hypothetical protein